jgi:hypothetical protein
MVLALGPLVLEAGLFEQSAGAVEEERSRHLLAPGVLRVTLHHAAAGSGDQLHRPPQLNGRHPLATVTRVNEEAREPVIGEDYQPGHPADGSKSSIDPPARCWR